MAAQPAVTTVQFDDLTFLAFATEFSVFTPHDGTGLPRMGQSQFAIQVSVDMHDTQNISFDTVKKLFDHSHSMTSDKVKQCKLTYWADDQRQNALSTFAFQGWLANFTILSGGGSNHLLILKIQPRPSEKQFVDIQHGN
jgi:hypothetical protein